jgi:hypothetical protein
MRILLNLDFFIIFVRVKIVSRSFFFYQKTANKRNVIIYTPERKYEGIEEIRNFAKEFLGKLNATSAKLYPVIQTQAAGRSVSEVEIAFETGEEEPYKVPMAIFADLGPEGKMESLRIYYFYQWIPGTPAYYRPIFRPSHNEPAELNQLSGIMKFYYEQLHNNYQKVQLDNLVSCFADNPRMGGYRPTEMNPPMENSKEVVRKKYSKLVDNIPSDLYIRFETITDDGRNCLCEFTSIVRKHALTKGLVSQAGMVAYERDENGKIISVRICDNFKWEHEIDYSTVFPEDNFVD